MNATRKNPPQAPSQALPKTHSQTHPLHDQLDRDVADTQDLCDIEFSDAEQTPDEDLPASTGGIA